MADVDTSVSIGFKIDDSKALAQLLAVENKIKEITKYFSFELKVDFKAFQKGINDIKKNKVEFNVDFDKSNKVVEEFVKKVKKIEDNRIKISTSVQGGDEFDRFIAKVQSEGRNISNTKFNIGIKQVEGQSFNDIQAQYEKLKGIIGGEANIFRINTQQASNAFAQIKEEIKSISDNKITFFGKGLDDISGQLKSINGLVKAQFVLEFAGKGLDVIEGSIKNLSGLLQGAFNNSGFKNTVDLEASSILLENTFAGQRQKAGLDNSQGQSQEEADKRIQIGRNLADKTAFSDNNVIDLIAFIENIGFDSTKNVKNGDVIGAGKDNILNTLTDIFAKQSLLFSDDKALLDTKKIITGINAGNTAPLTTLLDLPKTVIDGVIEKTGLGQQFKDGALTKEESLKFINALNDETNISGLSLKQSGSTKGIFSTLQSKFDQTLASFFGSTKDGDSLISQIKLSANELISYFDSEDGKKLKLSFADLGKKLGVIVKDLITPENINSFGDNIIEASNWLKGLFTETNKKKIQDGFNGVASFFGLETPDTKGQNTDKNPIDKIKDTGIGALAGLPSFSINPLAGFVGTGVSGFFGNKLGGESGIGAGIGSFIGGIGGSIGGGIGGGSLGGTIGTGIGGAIGTAFGGIGAVPGAAAGGAIGTTIGSAIGGTIGAGAGAGAGGTAGGGVGALFSEENRKSITDFFTQDIPTWLGQAGQSVSEFFTSNGAKVGAFFNETIVGNFNQGKQFLQNWFTDRGNDFNNTVTAWKTDINNFFNQDWNQILIDTATNFGIWTGERVRDFNNTINEWSKNVIKFFLVDIPAAQESAKVAIVNWTVDRAKDYANFSESISKSVSKFFLEDIPNFQQEAFNTLNKFFTKDIPGFIDPIPGKFNDKLTETNTYVGDRVKDMAQFFADLPGNIGKSLLGVGDAIKGAFGDAGSFLVGIGNNIDKAKNAFGDGFLQGFQGEKKALGGRISGGSGVRDDVPVMAMGGEYVIKKSSIQALDKFDPNFIDRLNQDPMATLNNAVRSIQSSTSNYYQNQISNRAGNTNSFVQNNNYQGQSPVSAISEATIRANEILKRTFNTVT
jgi:hypothetical protein